MAKSKMKCVVQSTEGSGKVWEDHPQDHENRIEATKWISDNAEEDKTYRVAVIGKTMKFVTEQTRKLVAS